MSSPELPEKIRQGIDQKVNDLLSLLPTASVADALRARTAAANERLAAEAALARKSTEGYFHNPDERILKAKVDLEVSDDALRRAADRGERTFYGEVAHFFPDQPRITITAGRRCLALDSKDDVIVIMDDPIVYKRYYVMRDATQEQIRDAAEKRVAELRKKGLSAVVEVGSHMKERSKPINHSSIDHGPRYASTYTTYEKARTIGIRVGW